MINIYNHFPISISSSSNAQDIIFNFNENIDSIVSKITFVLLVVNFLIMLLNVLLSLIMEDIFMFILME